MLEINGLKAGQVYAHYKKGDLYTILCLAQDEDDADSFRVIYTNASGRIFSRPAKEWMAPTADDTRRYKLITRVNR